MTRFSRSYNNDNPSDHIYFIFQRVFVQNGRSSYRCSVPLYINNSPPSLSFLVNNPNLVRTALFIPRSHRARSLGLGLRSSGLSRWSVGQPNRWRSYSALHTAAERNKAYFSCDMEIYFSYNYLPYDLIYIPLYRVSASGSTHCRVGSSDDCVRAVVVVQYGRPFSPVYLFPPFQSCPVSVQSYGYLVLYAVNSLPVRVF